MKKRFAARTAFVVATTTAMSAAAMSSASAQQIKIDALYPISGALALLGDESFRGVELAIDERNAAGGLKGRKIEIVKGDAVGPGQAVGEARRLTSVAKAPAISGAHSSSLSLAATQVTELASIPYFELGAVSDPITERGYKHVFRTNPTAKDFGSNTVDAVLTKSAPRARSRSFTRIRFKARLSQDSRPRAPRRRAWTSSRRFPIRRNPSI